MIFQSANIFAENQFDEDKLTNCTQLIGYDFCKYTFKDFVKTPTAAFAESNSCVKVIYSKTFQPRYCEFCEYCKNYKLRYEYNYNHVHYKGGIKEKYETETGFAGDGHLRFSLRMPIYSEFIDFVNSEDNIRDLIKADENTIIKNSFLFNKFYGDNIVVICVDIDKGYYFIEIRSKLMDAKYKTDYSYSVYTHTEINF